MSIAQMVTENVWVLNFLENGEIIFHLEAMCQCKQGGEGHLRDSAHADSVKSTASED